jgi:2-methylisocitrate lyase-like PEP mutase family enzyme
MVNSSVIIVDRTRAMAVTGVEDTIARLKAHGDAGVDMLFIVGVKKRGQLNAMRVYRSTEFGGLDRWAHY